MAHHTGWSRAMRELCRAERCTVSGQLWSTPGQTWPIGQLLVGVGKRWPLSGQMWSISSRFWPNLAGFGLNSAEVGPNLARTLADVGRTYAIFGTFGRNCAEFRRFGPHVGQIHMLGVVFRRLPPISPNFGRRWSTLDRSLSTFAEFRPRVVEICSQPQSAGKVETSRVSAIPKVPVAGRRRHRAPDISLWLGALRAKAVGARLPAVSSGSISRHGGMTKSLSSALSRVVSA